MDSSRTSGLSTSQCHRSRLAGGGGSAGGCRGEYGQSFGSSGGNKREHVVQLGGEGISGWGVGGFAGGGWGQDVKEEGKHVGRDG